jgi:putative ABC transport system ATP-binding protein
MPAIHSTLASVSGPSAAPPLIELRNVAKRYQLGEVAVDALRDVTLTIARGEFVAIMGASGSGKSTLMNIVGCLDRPTTGSYRLDGVEMARESREALADLRNRTLGFVFQSFNLLTRTSAVENVELPLLYQGVATKERVLRSKEALERVGLGKRMDHHPSQLSGGQQQRVAIARAIVGKPKVILADEPTGNLDSRTSVEVMALFQQLGRDGITVVLVTHESDIAEYAARVVVMRDGHVVSDTRQAPKDATKAMRDMPAEEALA